MPDFLQIGPLVTLAVVISGGLAWGIKTSLAKCDELREEARDRDQKICALETKCAVLAVENTGLKEIVEVTTSDLDRRMKLQEDMIPIELSRTKELAARADERLKRVENKT